MEPERNNRRSYLRHEKYFHIYCMFFSLKMCLYSSPKKTREMYVKMKELNDQSSLSRKLNKVLIDTQKVYGKAYKI